MTDGELAEMRDCKANFADDTTDCVNERAKLIDEVQRLTRVIERIGLYTRDEDVAAACREALK